MAKKFTTIFPITVNSHLIKDLGQIPHFLNQRHNFETEIVTYQNSENYYHTEGEVHGVNIKIISDIGKKHFLEKGVIKYLNENAATIDVLNLYHFKKDTFFYGNLYKKLHPKGKLFLKMDAYNEHFREGRLKHTTKSLKRIYFKNLEKKFLKNVDLVTIENKEGLRLVKKCYPELENKLHYMPNGINDVFLKESFPKTKNYDQKENILLTVGRIGLDVKNNEMLLKVIPKLDLKDWKILFVGPIHQPFLKKIKQFYDEYPNLKDRVEFVGEISDRKKLYEYYNRSKICCLTSPFESFGIAFVEAMYFGNFIIGTTGMSAFADLSNDFEYGEWTEVNDDEKYADIIQNLIDDDAILEKKCEQIKTFTNEHFSWSTIVAKLNKKLND